MTYEQIKDKLFPAQYSVVITLVYVTCAFVVYQMGVASLQVLPHRIIQINGIASILLILGVAGYGLKRFDRVESKQGLFLGIGHVLLATGIFAPILQSLLTGTTRSLKMIPFAFLFLVFFYALTAGGIFWFNRSRRKVEGMLQNRREIASMRFVTGMAGNIALGMMRPKRRFAFLAASFSLMAVVVVSIFVLAIDRHFFVAGVLLVTVIAAIETIEAVMYAEVVERKSVEGELNAARTIQMGLMPKEDPKVPGFDISGRCVPANEVGGDFFDYVWLDVKKTKLGIALADVSGKALKAAMTAVMTSGMVYEEVGNSDSPKTILGRINRPMYLKTDKQVFTALSFAVIDVRKKSLTFSNAGQSQPIILRGNKLTYLKVKGTRLPLGVAEDQQYSELTLRLKSDDLVLFYTDGLPEATNARHELLGFEALEREFVRLRTGSSSEIVDGMTELVIRHTGKTEQHDDMTVVVVRVL